MALAIIDVEARTGKAKEDIKGVGIELHSVGKAADSVAAGMAKGFAIVGAGAAATVAAAAHAARAAMQWADAHGVAAAKMGVSIEASQRLKFVAEQTDVPFETLQKSIGKMQLALDKTPAAFQRLGLSVGDLKKQAPEEQLASIADKLNAIEDPTQRAAAANSIFGKSWQELAPLFEAGGAAIRTLGDDAVRLGAVMSKDVMGAGRDLDDTVTKLNAVWDGLIRNFGAAVTTSEPLHRLLNGLVEILGSFSKKTQNGQADLRSFVDAGVMLAADGLVLLVQGIGYAVDMWSAFKIGTEAVKVALQSVAIMASASAEAFRHPTQAGAILKQALLDVAAAGNAGNNVIQAEIAANIERRNKLAEVEVKMAALAATVRAADGVTHTATKAAAGHAGALDYVSAAADRAAGKLANYNKGLAMGPSNEDMERIVDKGGKTATMRNALYHNDTLPNMARPAASAVPTFDFRGVQAEAVKMSTQFKAAFKAGLKDLPSVIVGAIQGGGNVGQAIGAHLGGTIGQSLQGSITKGLGGLLGKKLGESLGSLAGPLGSIVGGMAGKLGAKLLGGLFGGEEKKRAAELAKLRADFISSAGGIDALRLSADKAGVSIDAMLKAKTAKELEAAIKRIKSELDLAAEVQQKVTDATKRYGFTLEELGPALQRQELDKQAGQLYEDFQLLNAAGIDTAAILSRMGPAASEFVQQALRTGTEIPRAMQPMLRDMAAAGTLIDANGRAYSAAEVDGFSYTDTMSRMFSDLIKKVDELVAALKRIPSNVSTTHTFDERRTGGSGSGWEGDLNESGTPDRDGDPTTNFAKGTGGNLVYFPAQQGGHKLRVSEGGRGEYVQVGHNPAEFGGAGGGITVHVNAPGATAADVERIRHAAREGAREGLRNDAGMKRQVKTLSRAARR